MKLNDISKLQRICDLCRAEYPDMSLTMLQTLLEVAKGHGVTGRGLEEALNKGPASISQAACSRNLRFFDAMQTAGREGLGMTYEGRDAQDFRTKVRFLTDKGEDFVNKIAAIMEE